MAQEDIKKHEEVGDFVRLQLLHGNDIGGLDVVLVLLDLLLKLVQRDLVVLDDKVDLELLDTEANGDQLGGTPDEAVLLNGKDVGLKLVHVGLIIWIIVSNASRATDAWTHTPGLDVEGDDGLGSRLDLAGLLLVVLGQTLGLDALSLLILLGIGAEQVDIIIILLLLLLGGLGGVDCELRRLGAVGSVVLGHITGEGGELRLEGQDVVVPAPRVGVLLGRGDSLQLLEDLDIGLGGSVAVMQSATCSISLEKAVLKRMQR